MGDLKGILDKEGINLSRNKSTRNELTQKESTSLERIISELDETSTYAQDRHEIELPVLTESISINTMQEEAVYSELANIDTTGTTDSQHPVSLDDYISDIEDDEEALQEFASSFEELEEKVESITDPDHLHQFKHNLDLSELNKLKESLEKHLSLKIEKVLAETKIKLIDSMQNEINDLFNKFS